MSTLIQAHKGSRSFDSDNASCSVIAVEHAFNIEKEEAREYCAIFGRKRNCGMYGVDFNRMVTYMGANLLGIFGSTESAISLKQRVREAKHYKGMSLGSMMKYPDFKSGTYIVYVTDHFTVIKDGCLYDPNGSIKGGTSVIAIWKV